MQASSLGEERDQGRQQMASIAYGMLLDCFFKLASTPTPPAHQHLQHTNTTNTSSTPTPPTPPAHQHLQHTNTTNTSSTPTPPTHQHTSCSKASVASFELVSELRVYGLHAIVRIGLAAPLCACPRVQSLASVRPAVFCKLARWIMQCAMMYSEHCGTSRMYSEHCGTSRMYSQHCGTSRMYSQHCGTSRMYSQHCGTSRMYSLHCGTSRMYSQHCGTSRMYSQYCGTRFFSYLHWVTEMLLVAQFGPDSGEGRWCSVCCCRVMREVLRLVIRTLALTKTSTNASSERWSSSKFTVQPPDIYCWHTRRIIGGVLETQLYSSSHTPSLSTGRWARPESARPLDPITASSPLQPPFLRPPSSAASLLFSAASPSPFPRRREGGL
ncbi:hypothetical protein FHG87_006392 [Trinorchestia longiramus]|nr:hypothetical protein FHG87_006392 [Trinorchestia longiramus]